MLSMMYNMDYSRFREFKKFLEAMRNGNFQTAFWQLLNAKRTNDVKGRVAHEAMMILYGTWEVGSKAFPKEADKVNSRDEGKIWGKERLQEYDKLMSR